MIKSFISFTLVLNCLIPIQAQRLTHHQTLYWLRYQNQLHLSPTTYWTNEIDNRRFINPDVQNQLIAHSHIHIKRVKFDGAIGLSYSRAYASRPEIGYTKVVIEVRPFIEGSYTTATRKISIQHRIRIDNRFFEVDSKQSLFEESLFVQRYRYRLQARIPLAKDDTNNKIACKLANEIMLNHKKNIFDQNRIYATVEYLLNNEWTLEAGYIYMYQQRFGVGEYFSRNVLRFSIIHRIFTY